MWILFLRNLTYNVTLFINAWFYHFNIFIISSGSGIKSMVSKTIESVKLIYNAKIAKDNILQKLVARHVDPSMFIILKFILQ